MVKPQTGMRILYIYINYALQSSFHVLYMLITWLSYGVSLKRVYLFYAAFYSCKFSSVGFL